MGSWWLPELDLQHIDGNDNDPYLLVPLARMLERAEAGERIAAWIKAEPARRSELIDKVLVLLEDAEPTVAVRQGLFSTRVIVR